MKRYILKRIFGFFPISFVVVFLVGLMIHLIPGNPVDLIAGDYASEAQKHEIRIQLGLDQPLISQVVRYYLGIFKGDLGNSLVSHRPVLDLIRERVWPTFELAILSLIFSCGISIPLGAACAYFSGKALDLFVMSLSFTGLSMPSFWLGPLLIFIFSVHLGWLPVSGRSGLSHFVLPVLTLSASLSAVLIRITRLSFKGQLTADYVRTARSKGLNDLQVFLKHIFKNASLPITTIVSLQFGVLVTGTIITEKVFDWPGLGTLISEAIERRDYPVVQGCVFVFSFAFLFTSLMTDILYSVLDPRIRVQEEK